MWCTFLLYANGLRDSCRWLCLRSLEKIIVMVDRQIAAYLTEVDNKGDKCRHVFQKIIGNSTE
jgi:hypothetical protein